MEQRTFGSTGLTVSAIGFGGAPIGVLATDQERVNRLLQTLLDQGVNVIDTAAGYRGSEAAIGDAIGHRRDAFVLISKCGQTFPDLTGAAWSAKLIAQTIDRSLQRLRTDHLDVMLLHTCDLKTLQRGEAIGALVKAREQGKIRFCGYSGDNEAVIYAAEQPDIRVLETSINICDQANITGVLPVAQERELGVIVKRPIANAAWKPLQDQRGFYADYARTYTERFAAMGVTLEQLSRAGDTVTAWPEVALRFTLMQPGVHTAIIGTTDPAHADANLRFAALGPLSDEQAETWYEAFKAGAAAAGENWPGLT